MKIKNLIIGAGISGLTMADCLGKDYLVVEKENEPGGYCRTIRKKDYIWDYAGHFYHFKTEYFKNLFKESVPESEVVNKVKCTKIYYKDRLIDYPFQTNIHQLDKSDFIDCLYDLFFKIEKDQYDNFLDMLYGKFGKSITEKFLRPYNEKLYSIDLTKLDKDAMGRFFPYADLEQIIRNMKCEQDYSYNNTFLYPKNGADVFVNVLYNKIDKSAVRLNTEVVHVDIEKKTATLSTGEEITYQNLINTMPLHQFLQICGESELADTLSYNKVLVFNLGFNKKSEKFGDEHWIYLPERKYNFYRIGFYDNILDFDKLSMYIEIGFSKDDDHIDIDRELEKTLEGLRDMGVTDESMVLEDSVSILMDPAYVHISTETDQKIGQWKQSVSEKNVYSIGRYGKWTYCSMEDCMLGAQELAKNLPVD